MHNFFVICLSPFRDNDSFKCLTSTLKKIVGIVECHLHTVYVFELAKPTRARNIFSIVASIPDISLRPLRTRAN